MANIGKITAYNIFLGRNETKAKDKGNSSQYLSEAGLAFGLSGQRTEYTSENVLDIRMAEQISDTGGSFGLDIKSADIYDIKDDLYRYLGIQGGINFAPITPELQPKNKQQILPFFTVGAAGDLLFLNENNSFAISAGINALLYKLEPGIGINLKAELFPKTEFINKLLAHLPLNVSVAMGITKSFTYLNSQIACINMRYTKVDTEYFYQKNLAIGVTMQFREFD